METLDQKFVDWVASFSGCDGGDRSAKTWLCGIEWGGVEGSDYYEQLQAQIQKGRYEPGTSYEWKEHVTYRYGLSFAKLYAAIRGRNTSTYQDLGQYDGAEIFKLNLYPIAFQRTDAQLWQQHGLDKLTGFQDKHLFQTWCKLHRFPFLSEQVRSNGPELIIGTGISYLSDFFLCFAQEMDKHHTLHVEYLTSEKKSDKDKGRPFYWARVTAHTTLVVIPFFSGANGLNSDKLLQEAGNKIHQLLG